MGDVDEIVLEIDGSSFSAALDFINNRLAGYFIKYNKDGESFTINGDNFAMGIDRYYYMDENDKEQTKELIDFETPEDKDLLAKFNETTMKRYEEKIAKRQISENEAKEFLLEVLDYLNTLTRGGLLGLTEKVKNAVKSENVKVGFHKRKVVMRVKNET